MLTLLNTNTQLQNDLARVLAKHDLPPTLKSDIIELLAQHDDKFSPMQFSEWYREWQLELSKGEPYIIDNYDVRPLFYKS